MLPVILGLWLWLGYVLGFITISIANQPNAMAAAADATSSSSSCSPSSDPATTFLDPELYDKALMHARTLSMSSTDGEHHDNLLRQIQEGNVEALYAVAQSLNGRGAGDDRITSVQLWHALADGPAAHVPSAVALGFSYVEVDKERALFYFVQASRGKEDDEDGGPHQAALFNAGRLFLELNDAASSLAYIRGCANVEKEHPEYADDRLTETCASAYAALSDQIRSREVAPPGIEDAAEMFLYASADEFPEPNTKEFGTWSRGMEYLEKYAAMVREGRDDPGKFSGKKGQTYLMASQQELESLQKSSDKMSELQRYLLDIILGRIQVSMTAMEEEEYEDGDEL